MIDERMVTWKVIVLMPVLLLGEAMYRLCDFTIERILEPLADMLSHWCLKEEYKRG